MLKGYCQNSNSILVMPVIYGSSTISAACFAIVEAETDEAMIWVLDQLIKFGWKPKALLSDESEIWFIEIVPIDNNFKLIDSCSVHSSISAFLLVLCCMINKAIKAKAYSHPLPCWIISTLIQIYRIFN